MPPKEAKAAASEENVKVAVRVRPFNQREKDRNAVLVVKMNGNSTSVSNPDAPNDQPKSFTFDYSYWSHDGFKEGPGGYMESASPSSPYSDQKRVFADLGEGIMKNAHDGYNATLFAYGQTGSGKSYSVVGYGSNKGLVPMFCDRLFQEINAATDTNIKHEVQFSMLEIYNEIVRDLLNPSGDKRAGLKVRENPKKGFYADGLMEVPVASYTEIEKKMEEGTTNRTVASTNMNATSSRAHTIITITYAQKYKNSAGEETTKSSVINLVDLAGSERADATGATGERLKEGAAINLSLTTLGNVISALADQSSGKDTRVPYRDSTLTRLLKNALGGNSRTIMIAAISPADINYDETLSTLRYADRAKQIKTKATVNEDPTQKLIRDLQEENERLKKMFEGGHMQMTGEGGKALSEEEIAKIKQQAMEDYKATMAENDRKMADMQKTFEERLAEAQKNSGGSSALNEIAEKKKTTPYFYNINQDEQLSGRITQFVSKFPTRVGKKKDCEIQLSGASIVDVHANVTQANGKIYIEKADQSARLLVNGDPVEKKMEIKTNFRILFGTNQLFVFVNPLTKEDLQTISYDMAQREIATKSGLDIGSGDNRKDAFLQEEIMELKADLDEANAMSMALEKSISFQMALVPGAAKGDVNGKTELWVLVTDVVNGYEWLWPREKFMERKGVMEEMFEQKQEGNASWKQLPLEKDPFWENPDTDILIGFCKFWPSSLAYKMETIQSLDVVDLKGATIGTLKVELHPCDAKGREFTEQDDVFVEDPSELLRKDPDLHFVMKVFGARGLPGKYGSTFAKFKLYEDFEFTCTPRVTDKPSNPDWDYTKTYHWKLTEPHLVYLRGSAIPIQIWGKIDPKKVKKAANAKTELAKLLRQDSTANLPRPTSSGQRRQPPTKDIMQNAVNKLLLQTRDSELQKLRRKINWINKLVQESKFAGRPTVGVTVLEELLNTEHDDRAQTIIAGALKNPVPTQPGAAPPQQSPPPQNNGGGPGGPNPNDQINGTKSSQTCCLI